jgi:putative Mg2+ transporter-C (MgtC) family protein
VFANDPQLFGLHMPIWDALARLSTAMLFAAIIGWEREANGRAAGLRTHMLVALGAAGFTLVGVEFVAAAREAGSLAADPVKIIQAVATGVGFLGAGAIMQTGMQVKGLTTAASIWVVAAVGVASGAGYWALSLMLAGLALLTLTVLRWLEPPKKDE